MAEQAKPAPPTQEHPYPPPTIVPYPHQGYNGPYPPPGPPGAYMPPFFAYPPPPDGSHPEAGQNGVPPTPYMIGLPPGVVYAYQTHPQTQPFTAPPASASTPPALAHRPKRKQVKMACTNCAGACKRCDETRPCERCVKYGIADSCVDGQRKERKKGIKRGPYKRKAKGEADSPSFSGGGDWPNGTPPSSTTSAPGIHPVQAPYAPEGYYPVYYPPPGFMPHPHDGQPGPDGSPSHPNGQPIMPYYIHPGSYQFPHYPPIYPPGAPPPPGAQPSSAPVSQAASEQPQTVNPSDTGRKEEGASGAERNGVEAAGAGKKRSRTTKNGEPKAKKVKTAVNGTPVPAVVPPPAHVEKDKRETPQSGTGEGDDHDADGVSGDGDKSA
ncbi:hypothetical protein GALMADRAFT_242061 [Galerina marginata CBS 339.88]|uniref:Transcription activator of gluconeogenesis ERT1 n=1 Tax=Galerina marginata (strain CBS 339.88) TaxID=685588 RepID=A0A067T9T2_GALM3|nr:hypothetical protein GALMADRAFT_242061 [Galerina marginata CBS 339.88]